MQIRAAEISDIIREQIKEYEKQLEVRETGVVLSAGDGIARIYGLDKAAAGELIEFPHGIYGLVLIGRAASWGRVRAFLWWRDPKQSKTAPGNAG